MNMKYSNKFVLFIILLTLFIFHGCFNSETDKKKLEVDEVRKEIKHLEIKNEKLLQKIQKLKKFESEFKEVNAAVKNLQVENQILKKDINHYRMEKETLSVKNNELNEWSKKLVEGYGTGLWIADESTYPVFARSMKSADVPNIINELNRLFGKNEVPKIILKKIVNRKVYIKFDNSDYLTQRMGTSGASSYLKEVSFSIYSVKGIDCVNFDFKEGDHAFPGEYCK